jgi:ribosome-binding protein aMBF1 (putative translation factor)
MSIRTPADLGALIRDQRTRLGLDQKSLAQKVGGQPTVDRGSGEGQAAGCQRAAATHRRCSWTPAGCR